MSQNSKNILIAVLVFILLVGAGAGAFYLGKNQQIQPEVIAQKPIQNLQEKPTTSQSVETKPEPPKPEVITPKVLFSGTVKKIEQDLDLIDKISTPIYYSAGKVLSGKYKDYDRIVADYTQQGPTGPTPVRPSLTFLTNDNQKYVVVNAIAYNSQYLEYLPAKNLDEVGDIQYDEKGNPITFLNKNKVVSLDTIEEESPQTIKLDNNFSLYKIGKYDNNTIDSSGNFVDLGSIVDYSKLTKLNTPSLQYNIYIKPFILDSNSKTEEDEYIAQDKDFIISDSTGIASYYQLVWNSSIDAQANKLQAYQVAKQKSDQYNTKSSELRDKITKEKPNASYEEIDKKIEAQLGTSPEYVTHPIPSINLTKSDFVGFKSDFENYNNAFPGGCGASISNPIILKNISDTDLVKIATKDGADIFKLKDPKHPLYKSQYDRKIDLYLDGGDSKGNKTKIDGFAEANPDKTKPTFEEYVAKNPLIFFKDPFGRVAVLGEYDYLLPGGCGKPVVYLYPSQPTKVSVKFLSNIQLTTDIPKYVANTGWNVLAKPNGEIKDLQPQYTNCDIFNSNHIGSEYAKEACRNNNYPYLYWSGNSPAATYPKIKNGWIVEKKDLETFLNTRLDQVGLTQKEKSDMLEYWVPYLNNQSGNYFRISFLQTREMNQLAPMQITPTPTKVFRIFLDWDNFENKPNFEIKPQILESLADRTGFTLVEWGGLKKYSSLK